MSKILDVGAEEQINLQKDLLFIESGEDVEDIFLAFKYYKLEWIWKHSRKIMFDYQPSSETTAKFNKNLHNHAKKAFTILFLKPLLMY